MKFAHLIAAAVAATGAVFIASNKPAKAAFSIPFGGFGGDGNSMQDDLLQIEFDLGYQKEDASNSIMDSLADPNTGFFMGAIENFVATGDDVVNEPLSITELNLLTIYKTTENQVEYYFTAGEEKDVSGNIFNNSNFKEDFIDTFFKISLDDVGDKNAAVNNLQYIVDNDLILDNLNLESVNGEFRDVDPKDDETPIPILGKTVKSQPQAVPEPTSILSLVLLGTIGATSFTKRDIAKR